MARTNATNFAGALQFPYATAGTDLFRKEDVQTLALAVDSHDHSTGKGLKIGSAGIAAPLTLTMAGSGSGANQGTLNLVDTNGSANLVLVANNGVSKAIRCTNANGGTLEVINAANSVVVFSVGDTGAVAFPGSLSAGGGGNFGSGQLTVRSTADNVSGTITLGDTIIQRWNANQVRFGGSASVANGLVVEAGGSDISGPTTFRGTVSIASDNVLQFAVNGYYWKGVASQAVLQTNGSLVVNAGSLYLDSSMSNRIYWDGTFFHSNKGLVGDAQIISNSVGFYSRDGAGNYYSGPGDASVIGTWNAGQWRIKSSSAGDLLAIRQITAEGGPVTGNGAYINSASSAEIKTNVVELDPAESLAKVLNPVMRPVQWEYIKAIAYPTRAPRDGALEPDPTYEMIPAFTPERLGFIAEEVNEVIPEACFMNDDGTAFGYQESTLLPLLWSAFRALEARLAALEAV